MTVESYVANLDGRKSINMGGKTYRPAHFRQALAELSGFKGDNLVKPSENAPWYKGFSIKRKDGSKVEGVTLLDALNNYVVPPKRDTSGPLRMPVSGVYKIKGVGDVITGRSKLKIVKSIFS